MIRTSMWVTCVSLAAIALGGVRAEEVSIRGETINARFDTASQRLTLAAKPSGTVFLRDGRLSGDNGTAKELPQVRRFRWSDGHVLEGAGPKIDVSYKDGHSDCISFFLDRPFALIGSSLHNGGTEATVTQSVTPFSAVVDLGVPAGQLKTFGTGGLLTADKNPGSYAWLAVVEPRSRRGVVFGWLTHDQGSGVLLTKQEGDAVRVEARIDYGRLRVAPGETKSLETLGIGYFDDARLGLEAWADMVASWSDVHLAPQPVGFCTWYSKPYGGASDQRHLAEQAAFAAEHLAPFGFSVVQIDDKWQAGVSKDGPRRNFTTHDPNGPYPSGMKAAADKVKSMHLVPGIWFMPFAGTSYDPFFAGHPDWFVRRADNGQPYETKWGGTCLDMTSPGAREHLRSVVQRISGQWGFQYVKIDGLWTGTGTKQQYVNSGYKEDGMGDAVFADPNKTNIEAYRDGLRLVREAAGPKVFILGCNGPQNMRSYGAAFGLVDAMRIGPDNGTAWASLVRGPAFGSRHYFLHGRIWYNDPDPVYVRDSMPLNHAQLICSWVAVSGQLNLNSEWLPGLSAGRLDILKRTMPGHGLLARPVDLFENDPPRIWLVTDARRTPRRDVIGLFNWDDREHRFDEPLDRIGLDPNTEYAAFDFWQNALLMPIKGRLQVSVPGQSCGILALRAKTGWPLLLSTSRHVTQGIVEVLDERWDAATRTLTGRSKVVGRDSYELRVMSGTGATAVEVSAEDRAAGVKATFRRDAGLDRVTVESPVSREVSWIVRYGPAQYDQGRFRQAACCGLGEQASHSLDRGPGQE